MWKKMIKIPKKYLFQKLILEQDWLFPSNYQNTNIYNTNSQTTKNIYVSSKCLRLQVCPVPSGRLLVKSGVEHLAHGNQQINYIPSVLRRINSLSERTQVLSVMRHEALTGQVQHQQILKPLFQDTDGRCHPAQASIWQGVVLQEKPFHAGRRDTNV